MGFLFLAACASHPPADMTDASDADAPVQDASGPGNRGGGGPGGGGGIWSEVLRTALQTGMGFVHH
ncbi:hypothetical protein GMO_15250 [Gluconobacter morbifer G707]|uniref:Uncharacterized protein n=1 Tax=Gluconobacter morbifer G707 TaxID=1088869 RepID=G6XJ59_9PROT|nr:hypothetical protein GMO_15250 [Gluconobacter morbifer G707]